MRRLHPRACLQLHIFHCLLSLVTMALTIDALVSFEEAVTSRQQLALYRMSLLREDGTGFAALFVPLLQRSLDSWFLAVETPAVHSYTECEEKKQEVNQQMQIAKTPETNILSRVLQVHVAVSRLDPTLAEELGRQGSHALLSRLMQYDGCLRQEEEDQDVIMELQDYCCTMAALTGGVFPLKVAPFSSDDLRLRLPLSFHIHAVNDNNTSDRTDPEISCNSQLVLINQVTERQSAQDDVGFGK